MHEERLERFEDFRDANDRSSAGNDASSSGNDASSAPKDSSPAPDASVGGTAWIDEAREEASRRKSDHPLGQKHSEGKDPNVKLAIEGTRAGAPLAATGPVRNEGSDEALFPPLSAGRRARVLRDLRAI